MNSKDILKTAQFQLRKNVNRIFHRQIPLEKKGNINK